MNNAESGRTSRWGSWEASRASWRRVGNILPSLYSLVCTRIPGLLLSDGWCMADYTGPKLCWRWMQRLLWCSVKLFDALICFAQGVCACVTVCVCVRDSVCLCNCVCVQLCVIWGKEVLPTTCRAHLYTKTCNPCLPTPQHDTTLLLHRAPQLIADPTPNPLLGHHITQSHVHSSHRQPPQTGRNGSGETTVLEVPDATAQGASVVVVWCAWGARLRTIYTHEICSWCERDQ